MGLECPQRARGNGRPVRASNNGVTGGQRRNPESGDERREDPQEACERDKVGQTQGRGRGMGRQADWETSLAMFISFQNGLWRECG